MAKFSCPVCKAPTNDESGCFRHKPKKQIKKSYIKPKLKTPEKIQEEKENSEKMKAFFFYCWENLPRCSEIPPYTKFYGEIKSYYFHHVWEKSTHDDIKFSILNILRVTGDQHSCLNGDLEYFEEAKRKREWVKNNYETCKKQSLEWEDQYKLKLQNEDNLWQKN